jgi:tRNA(fMet)-specific endonuclease VapC
LILLDANTVVYYSKGIEPVVTRWQSMSRMELAIPSVVAYEIEYGRLRMSSLRRRDVVGRLMEHLAQVPFDQRAAHEAARIRRELEEGGRVIGPMDLLIAGTAMSRGAVLVTNNTREFSRVKGLRLLDWTR